MIFDLQLAEDFPEPHNPCIAYAPYPQPRIFTSKFGMAACKPLMAPFDRYIISSIQLRGLVTSTLYVVDAFPEDFRRQEVRDLLISRGFTTIAWYRSNPMHGYVCQHMDIRSAMQHIL